MNIFKQIVEWFNTTPTDYRLERYLAQSTDNADLEYRMKKWQFMSENEKYLH